MASGTLYVDGVNGSDSNACQTAETACKTIEHAISLAPPDESIMVAPATYQGPISITKNLNIVGAGARTTIIKGLAYQSGEQGVAAVTIPFQISGAQLNVTLSGLTITGTYNGSGVSTAGVLTISDSIISGNGVVPELLDGGGIANAGVLTVSKTTVSGNTANSGGGIYCVSPFVAGTATMRIINSTISGNSAVVGSDGEFGGGIYAGGCPTTIINSTITGNSAFGEDGNGGGIFAHATMFVNNSTISGNTAEVGGGIAFYPDLKIKVTLQNSIVANNVSLASIQLNCGNGGTLISDGYNLSSDDSCNFNNTGDMNDTDPKLGPLQNNGGPTETMALLCMSPAINTGNPTGCTDGHGHLLHTDQRGDKRPGDPALTTGCDIGAYEVQFPK
jgi:hypothetical protein